MTQELPVIDIIHQKHLPGSLIGKFHPCIRHHPDCCRDRLDEQSVIVYAAEYFPPVIQDIFTHHSPETDFIQL